MTNQRTRPERYKRRYEALRPGHAECYECGGDGACTLCGGAGKLDGRRCENCNGSGLCIVCAGEGQLPPTKTVLEVIGAFRELELTDALNAPSIADSRGQRAPNSKAEVVNYLRSGNVLVVSPGGMASDVFDPTRRTTTRAIVTDGRFAWSRELAYYVEVYDVALPAHFEEYIAAHNYLVPETIDTSRLILP